MPQTPMPNIRRGTSDRKSNFGRGCCSRKSERVKAAITCTHVEDSMSNLVVHNKKRCMKFKVNMVILTKFLNRKKVSLDVWNMKNISERKNFVRRMDMRVTYGRPLPLPTWRLSYPWYDSEWLKLAWSGATWWPEGLGSSVNQIGRRLLSRT